MYDSFTHVTVKIPPKNVNKLNENWKHINLEEYKKQYGEEPKEYKYIVAPKKSIILSHQRVPNEGDIFMVYFDFSCTNNFTSYKIDSDEYCRLSEILCNEVPDE